MAVLSVLTVAVDGRGQFLSTRLTLPTSLSFRTVSDVWSIFWWGGKALTCRFATGRWL